MDIFFYYYSLNNFEVLSVDRGENVSRIRINPVWSSGISMWHLKSHFSYRISKRGELLQCMHERKAKNCKCTPTSLTVVKIVRRCLGNNVLTV